MKNTEAIAGTTWVVTGASSGIGRQFAQILARAGASVDLVGRNGSELERTAKEFPSAEQARLFELDLSNRDDLETLVREIESTRPIGLVNNAGFSTTGAVTDSDEESQLAQIEVNIQSLLRLSRAFLPFSIERRQGYLLNVASIAGFQAVPTQAVYAASKAWVASFTTSLHEEVRRQGVHVSALCPGLTRTEFFDRAGISMEKRFAKWGSWQTASEVAEFGLEAVLKNRCVAIPGLNNRLLLSLNRFSPRPLVSRISNWLMR